MKWLSVEVTVVDKDARILCVNNNGERVRAKITPKAMGFLTMLPDGFKTQQPTYPSGVGFGAPQQVLPSGKTGMAQQELSYPVGLSWQYFVLMPTLPQTTGFVVPAWVGALAIAVGAALLALDYVQHRGRGAATGAAA